MKRDKNIKTSDKLHIESPYEDTLWPIELDRLSDLPRILSIAAVVCNEIWDKMDKGEKDHVLDVEDALVYSKGAIDSYIRKKNDLFEVLNCARGYISLSSDHIGLIPDGKLSRSLEKLTCLHIIVNALDEILKDVGYSTIDIHNKME